MQTDLSQWLIVIPARLGSQRLHQKPLQDLGGKPLIIQVHDKIQGLKKRGARVIIATDDGGIFDVCKRHGAECMMTSPEHQSGTDRCHEVATKWLTPYVMNVQGDEPFVVEDDLLRLCAALEADTKADIATPVYVNSQAEDFANPNYVKAVADTSGFALYFSRAPIPYLRDQPFRSFLHHQGVYAYRRKALDRYCQLPVTELEQMERLEQLRALANGMKILLLPIQHKGFGIDTPQDLEMARKLFASGKLP